MRFDGYFFAEIPIIQLPASYREKVFAKLSTCKNVNIIDFLSGTLYNDSINHINCKKNNKKDVIYGEKYE